MVRWEIWCVVASALLTGCATATRQGSTPQGDPIWRIECPPAGGCDEKAVEVCKGEYTPISDGDSYNVVTNTYTGQSTVGRRHNMLVVCLGRQRRASASEAYDPENPWREPPPAPEDPWQRAGAE